MPKPQQPAIKYVKMRNGVITLRVGDNDEIERELGVANIEYIRHAIAHDIDVVKAQKGQVPTNGVIRPPTKDELIFS